LQHDFERLLYDHDPDGMGATVGAPVDEYSDMATRLIRALRDSEFGVGSVEVIRGVIPTAKLELIAEIESAWNQ
jgi:hypothetical protein